MIIFFKSKVNAAVFTEMILCACANCIFTFRTKQSKLLKSTKWIVKCYKNSTYWIWMKEGMLNWNKKLSNI